MVAMVNVGGILVPANQTFQLYGGYGTTSTVTAAEAANVLARAGSAAMGGDDGKGGAMWTLDQGDQTGATLTMDKPVAAPKPAEAPKT